LIFALYINKSVDAAGQTDAKPSKYPRDPGYFNLADENRLSGNSEYRKLIGMLLYLTTNSRPDIAASVSILSHRVSNSRQLDMTEVKRVIRYLKATQNEKLLLSSAFGEQKLLGKQILDSSFHSTEEPFRGAVESRIS
jgi:hypothetical protein